MAKETNAATFYTNVFKAWPKAVGAKPTAELLNTVHALGARPGKQALAMALMLRDSGVSGAQIVMACGAPQLNKMRDTCSKGLAKRLPASATPEGHTVYRLALTGKGEQKVKKAAEAPKADAAEKPAKAKRATKAKAKPEPVIVAEPVNTPEVAEQAQA
jgi:hypothetical protein